MLNDIALRVHIW